MINEHARFTIAQQYLRAVEHLASRVGNPILHTVVDFLQTFCCLIIPQRDGKFSAGKPLHEKFAGSGIGDNVWVYVHDHEDLQHLSEDCAISLFLGKKDVPANYHHDNRFLVLRQMSYSPFFQGLLIAHEGFHAMTLTKSEELPDHDIHEYEAHCFEHELLREIGGSIYQQLLQQRIEQIRMELKERSIADCGPLMDFTYPLSLDGLWGSYRSTSEARMRKWELHQHAIYYLIQELDISYAEKAQIANLL